jgi:hypothetical protein
MRFERRDTRDKEVKRQRDLRQRGEKIKRQRDERLERVLAMGGYFVF